MTTMILSTLTNEDYHASDALSFSGLKEFAKSPAHYLEYKKGGTETSDSMALGTLFHMAVLETARFNETVVPVGDRRKKEFKEAAEAAEAKGHTTCSLGDYDKVCKMRDAVLSDPLCMSLLSKGLPEQSIFWTDPMTGVKMRCRPDYYRQGDGIIIDLKSTKEELDQASLEKAIWNSKYHWQAAHYLDGISELTGSRVNMFVHIFVMNRPPYLVQPAVLVDAAIEKARFEYQPLLEKFAECQSSNLWPGYPRPENGITELGLPAYAW